MSNEQRMLAVTNSVSLRVVGEFQLPQILSLPSPVPQNASSSLTVLRGNVKRLNRGDVETPLLQWLTTDQGHQYLLPSEQLVANTAQAEGKGDTVVRRAQDILISWDFVMEKRAMSIKGCNLFHSNFEHFIISNYVTWSYIVEDVLQELLEYPPPTSSQEAALPKMYQSSPWL